MGLCFCGLVGRTCKTDRPSTKKEVDPDCRLKVVKFLYPRNLWSKEIKQEQANYTNFTHNEVLTLEDLILSSPACNEDGVNGGDHLHALKQCSSRRVHPSLEAEIKQEKVLHKSEESFPVGIEMKADEGGNVQSNSSTFHRSTSAKLKKKVSFRSPEVADIFILEHSYEVFVAE